jgi:hypothetical protein
LAASLHLEDDIQHLAALQEPQERSCADRNNQSIIRISHNGVSSVTVFEEDILLALEWLSSWEEK